MNAPFSKRKCYDNNILGGKHDGVTTFDRVL